MIVFNKTSNHQVKRLNSSRSVRGHRRVNTFKKITKSNKDFLRALGFKVLK